MEQKPHSALSPQRVTTFKLDDYYVPVLCITASKKIRQHNVYPDTGMTCSKQVVGLLHNMYTNMNRFSMKMLELCAGNCRHEKITTVQVDPEQ